ncbi:ribose-phosphate pyrophosphokinase-like domain-containing protein [Shewanella algae]|uniref:ribose-phosphate pyrophosphokinase-like domain-containing protein n=1 Tax=Shewanella algae TaxID=38313 RepID=UPI003C675CD9
MDISIELVNKDATRQALTVEQWQFAGGEQHVRLAGFDGQQVESAIICARLQSSDAIMQLLLIKDALDRAAPGIQVSLQLPYFPYARQDRVCVAGEAFSAAVMAGLLRNAGFSQIRCWDLHSAVSEQLLEAEVFQASKRRDPATGAILASELNADVAGRSLLILDDICDGGRTFIELARLLKQKGAARVGLYVTHGLFSRGIEPLEGLIDAVFTTDSVCPLHPFESQIVELHTLKLFE